MCPQFKQNNNDNNNNNNNGKRIPVIVLHKRVSHGFLLQKYDAIIVSSICFLLLKFYSI